MQEPKSTCHRTATDPAVQDARIYQEQQHFAEALGSALAEHWLHHLVATTAELQSLRPDSDTIV